MHIVLLFVSSFVLYNNLFKLSSLSFAYVCIFSFMLNILTHLSVLCCVYVSPDSYLSVHTNPSLEARELLRIVGLKLDKAEEDMVLAVVSHTGGTP